MLRHQCRSLSRNGLLEPVTDIVTELAAKYGAFVPGFEQTTLIDGEWWSVPFYGQAGGLYVRRDYLRQHGLDVEQSTETYDKLREAALRIANPSKQLWGWGLPADPRTATSPCSKLSCASAASFKTPVGKSSPSTHPRQSPVCAGASFR
ncbi:MAG: extracellular solute-binding protein [Thermomicrobiales bacterium]